MHWEKNYNYDEATVTHFVGARIEVAVEGVSLTERRQPWSVLLRDLEDLASVEGGAAQQEDLGTRIVPDAGVQTISVHLRETV